jgi:beta-1,4-mannosyl-glycoprotein beta-1,4-N-acetylglucosaminyltransferase
MGFGRDFFQKEAVKLGMENASDNDILISSDLDEIPNPEILKQVDEILSSGKFFTFNQTTYYYYLNLLKEYDWQGTRMGKYGDLKNYSYNELRAQQNIRLSNGGWHFSFQGGLEKVKTKIKSYSHQEMNTPDIFEKLHNNIENNIDPFNRGLLNLVEIDNTYPKYLLENKEKYKHMIKS